MKILYLRTHFTFNLKAGGSVGHTAGVINAFRKNHNITIISNDDLPEVNQEVEIIKPFKLNVGLVNNLLEVFYNFRLYNLLKHRIKNYDILYHRYSGNSFVAAKLAKKQSIPLILEFNSSAYWAIKNWTIRQSFPKNVLRFLFNHLIRLPITKIIEGYNLKHATLIVVVSTAMKESLVSAGVPVGKILVNPNGVNPEKFSDQIDGTSIRKKYNISNQKVVYGFIGTFGQWHGIIILTKAIVSFYHKFPEEKDRTVFLLIGDGILMKEARNIISESGFNSNVIFTGLVPQHQAPVYLAACDIFLSPHVKNPDGTKFFGSPTKLFEYMAMGKPIIASNLDQIGEILEDNNDALLIPPGDIPSLVFAMKKLSQNESLRKKLGKESRRKVLKQYTWNKHVENILERLNEIRIS